MLARNNKKIWEEIEKVIENEIVKNNINKQELLEGIYYLNGNDSTPFDIIMNENLCEIGKIYKNEYYAVKIFLRKNGDLQIFTYPNLENLGKCKKDIIPFFVDEEEFNEFASNIFEYTDLKDVYDQVVDPKIFEMKYSDHSFEWEEEEEEEEEW